jgi:hypothetical protein
VFSETAPLGPFKNVSRKELNNLSGVAHGLEKILKRPAAGQVNADATSCFADARTDLEQLRTHGFGEATCGNEKCRHEAQGKQVAWN